MELAHALQLHLELLLLGEELLLEEALLMLHVAKLELLLLDGLLQLEVLQESRVSAAAATRGSEHGCPERDSVQAALACTAARISQCDTAATDTTTTAAPSAHPTKPRRCTTNNAHSITEIARSQVQSYDPGASGTAASASAVRGVASIW